jgi:cyclic pyranopterin phosphate synthase
MPRGGTAKLSHEDILTYEEILRLARIAISVGVTKIRITGGEPLVRKGIFGFIPQLTSLEGLEDVSLTTNGLLLKNGLHRLKDGGIKRLNISLDSLQREKYRRITGHDALEQVLEGIDLAGEMGFKPIKINMVVMKGLNDNEVLDFARLSLRHPYHIRFIEYMPVGTPASETLLQHVSGDLIKAEISELGELLHVATNVYDGPAERFRFKGAPGEIGFITPVSHHFCHRCNRLRLTASGNLRPCLLTDRQLDLKTPMRQGASDGDLAKIFLNAAHQKPYAHCLVGENTALPSSQMSSIGG